MKLKVLYIEDEQFLGRIVKETLEQQEFEVLWETDGAKVLKSLDRFKPDVVVLDIMLPNIDGYSLCRQIRSRMALLPVIFLTAKVDPADVVRGFEAGGTDYMRKPFSMKELIARIRNQLNLKNGFSQSSAIIEEEIILGRYRFDPQKYELHTPSRIIQLSQRDQEVLTYLVIHRDGLIDRKRLLQQVWGDDTYFNSRNLDVYIRKIRNYFSEDPHIRIQTLKGRGYIFLVDE